MILPIRDCFDPAQLPGNLEQALLLLLRKMKGGGGRNELAGAVGQNDFEHEN